MALKDSFTTIRYYTAADPYYYTVDNRPLTDLETIVDFIGDTLDAGFTTGTIKFANGLVGTPSIAFSGDTNTGLYWVSSDVLGIAAGGALTLSVRTDGVAIGDGLNYALGNSRDVILTRDAAQILAQRNGVNAQALRVYNTFTDASNYERATINWTDSANVFTIGTSNAGTGTARPMEFRTASTNWWQLSTSGHFLAKTDNTNDIGASGATRPRSVYVASRILDGYQTVTYSTSMTIDASTGNYFTITANNGTGFTINAPTNPVTGQRIYVIIRNTSGGALGTATWNAVFKMAAWTQPANANSRTIKFVYDGTNWVEFGRTTTDVPN